MTAVSFTSFSVFFSFFTHTSSFIYLTLSSSTHNRNIRKYSDQLNQFKLKSHQKFLSTFSSALLHVPVPCMHPPDLIYGLYSSFEVAEEATISHLTAITHRPAALSEKWNRRSFLHLQQNHGGLISTLAHLTCTDLHRFITWWCLDTYFQTSSMMLCGGPVWLQWTALKSRGNVSLAQAEFEHAETLVFKWGNYHSKRVIFSSSK